MAVDSIRILRGFFLSGKNICCDLAAVVLGEVSACRLVYLKVNFFQGSYFLLLLVAR